MQNQCFTVSDRLNLSVHCHTEENKIKIPAQIKNFNPFANSEYSSAFWSLKLPHERIANFPSLFTPMQHPQLVLGLCLLLVPYYNEHNVDSCHLLFCHAVSWQPHPVLSHSGNDSSAALMKNVCCKRDGKSCCSSLPPLVICFYPFLRQLWHISIFAGRIQLTNPEEKHLLGTLFCWLCEFTCLEEMFFC